MLQHSERGSTGNQLQKLQGSARAPEKSQAFDTNALQQLQPR